MAYGGLTYYFVANYFGGTGNDLVLEWANTRMMAWGANGTGILGNNTTTDSSVAVPVNVSGVLAGKTVISVCAGDNHALALCVDGSVAAWGSNSYYQLGNNGTLQKNVPVMVIQTGVLANKRVISLAAGTTFSLALCSDGTMAAWGSNTYGQLGDNGEYNSIVPVLVYQAGVLQGKFVTAIAASGSHSLALCSDGTLVAWGDNGHGQLGNNSFAASNVAVLVDTSGVLGGKTITAIAAGGSNSMVLCSDGTIAAWGEGDMGKLGSSAQGSDCSVPVLVDQTGVLAGKVVTAICAGFTHCMALCSDGTVAAWGQGGYGQLGNNSFAGSSVPVLVTQSGVLAGKTVIAISAGNTHAHALCADGTLTAWGGNANGQLGNNSTTNKNVPVIVSNNLFGTGERFVAVQAAYSSSLAMVAAPPPPLVTAIAATGITDTGATLNATVNAQGTDATVSIEWGLTQAYGTSLAASPAAVTGSTATPVSAAISGLLAGTTYHYRCVAVRVDGTVRSNDMTFTTSRLAVLAGLGFSSGTLSPSLDDNVGSYRLTVPFAAAPVTATPVTVSAGATVTVNGTVVTSGTASGPLDLVVGDNQVSIGVVSGDGLNVRNYQIKVVRLPGVFAFGSATDVPLAVSDLVATGTPVSYALGFAPVPGTSLTMVRNTGRNPIQGTFDSLSQGQRVLMTYDGTSYAFVANYYGGTGNDLVLQWANTRLLAWGYNNSGQLGNNSTSTSGTAVPVDMSGVLAGKTVTCVAAGNLHSLALCADGTLAAWGSNTYGQLGNNIISFSLVPVGVNQADTFSGKMPVAIAAGSYHNLALCADGTLAAWGINNYGQLGNNSTTTGKIPVLVVGTGVLAGKTITAISTGGSHSLALCSDGTLAAWGYNASGQLGNNSYTNSLVPIKVDQTGVLAGKWVVAMSGGANHTTASCDDGTLAAWGSNSSGQLGNNSTTGSKVAILANQLGVLAGRTVMAISNGSSHSAALCTDGTLAAWGDNSYGQLGNNSTVQSKVPVAVVLTGNLAGRTVTAVASGGNHNLALCADGTLAAWGYDNYGQLGNGATTNSSVPVLVNPSALVPGERIVACAGGAYHSLALTAMPLPAATSQPATGLTGTSATFNGSVNANGSAATVAFEYGLSVSYGNTLAASPPDAAGVATVAKCASIGGLLPGTTYHYRTVVSSLGGIVRGADMTFTTLSDNARLCTLAVDAGTFDPVFDRNITSYLSSVPYATTTMRVTPVTDHPAATVKVNGTPVVSGTASNAINLAVGNNTVTVVITAEDGITTMSYVIGITRGRPGADDSDHDGIPDLVDYAFGLNPASPGSLLGLPQPHETAGRWEIRFTQPAGVTGITYGAEWSATLESGSWSDIPDTGSGGEHVFSMPGGQANGFFRLKLTGN